MRRISLLLLLAAVGGLLAFLWTRAGEEDARSPVGHDAVAHERRTELALETGSRKPGGVHAEQRGDTTAPSAPAPAGETGSARIRVEDEAGAPVVGAEVSLRAADPPALAGDASAATPPKPPEKLVQPTAATGTAAFEAVPTGEASVWAKASGFEDGGRSIKVEPRTEATATVVLRRLVSVSGLVVFPTGEPVPHAKVVARLGGSLEGRTVLVTGDLLQGETTESADDGTFRFELNPGQLVTLSATHGTFAPGEHVLKPLAAEDGILLRLRPGATLRGTVLGRDGAAAAEAVVLVVPADVPEFLSFPNAVVGPGGGSTWISDVEAELGSMTEFEGEGEILRPWRTKTNGEGRFEIAGIPPPMRVRALAQGKDGARGAGAVVTFAVDATVVETRIQLEPRVALVVRALAPDGKPTSVTFTLEGAREHFLEPRSEGELVGYSTAEGSVHLDGLTGGRYRMRAQVRRCLPQALDVDLPNGGTKEVVVRGEAGGTLRVEVVDAAGRGVPNVRLQYLVKAHGNVQEHSLQESTDVHGVCVLEGLQDAAGSLSFSSDDHAWRELKDVRPRPEPLRVVLASHPVVTCRLVRDGVGLPHDYVWVEEHGAQAQCERTARVGADNLLTYVLAFPDEEVLLVLRPFEGARVVLGKVRMQMGETRDLGEVRLERGRTITGRVVDVQGKPAAGVSIRAEIPGAPEDDSSWGSTPKEGTSRVDGSFSIRGVHRGPAVLRTHHGTWASTVFEEDGSGREAVLTLVPGAFVEGLLNDAAGAPRSDAQALVAGPAREHWVIGGRDGKFRLGPLSPGEYRVFRESAKEPPLAQFTLTAGQTLSVTWRLP